MTSKEKVRRKIPGAYYDFDRSTVRDHLDETISKRDVREPCAWADAWRNLQAEYRGIANG